MFKNLKTTGAAPKKVAQALAGVAGVILIGGSGAVFGLNSQITSLNNKAQTREAEVGSSEQVTRRYQTTLDSYNETLGKIQDLESSVSQSSYVPTLLQQLQTLASSTHLTVAAVRPMPTAPAPVVPVTDAASHPKKKAPPPYDTLDISVDVKGTYANTATFLYSLTRFPKIISVSSAQMRPETAGPDQNPLSSPMITTSLHLTAYVFHDDPAAPAASGAPGVAPAPLATDANAVPAPPASAANASAFVAPGAQPATLTGAAARTAAGSIGAAKALSARSEVGVGAL
ncbi:hypothetical protein CCAX7_50510 [Capsulimonas corticalis]|uniref:Uncharacterized protein n=1 Tax=Capsulimonas corticalis TaxID=2219043 RepID=A0A402CPM3_9BACT|nr:hypothetical protein [Capsulimonas corticalis]BDI33000.1 hypothetical protein CCAX7_50510 [Capsulimonas corticalis]